MLSTKLPWEQANPLWASELNGLIKNPANNSVLLKNVSLTTGANTINHKLGRTPQGWVIADIDAAVSIYRSAAFNSLTLTLTASGDAVITLEVF